MVIFGDEKDDVDFGGLAFGAVKNSDKKFLVRFYYKKSDANRGDVPTYYVVEKVINWTNIYTSVSEVRANNKVSTTYYNAQGIPSDVPFDGVNIVVTRFSDGTTTTTKVVK